MLHVAFHDPQTWCQTDTFELKAKSKSHAFRWLHLGLNAAFEQWPSEFLAGSAVRGHVGGDEGHKCIMSIGAETILTAGIWSPWFTGRAAPYATRPYPIELLSTKHPLKQPKTSLESCIAKLLVEAKILDVDMQTHLLVGEYIAEVDEGWAAKYLVQNLPKNQVAEDGLFEELWVQIERLV